MKFLKKINTFHTLVFLISILLFSAGSCLAGDQNSSTDQEPAFEFTARIMKIDLDHNLMIVAEEEIHLLSTTQGNKKIWQTHFVDAAKKTIPVQRFKNKDKVFVLGNRTSSGAIEAEVVALLVPATDKIKISPQQQDNTVPPAPTYQEGGVWKN